MIFIIAAIVAVIGIIAYMGHNNGGSKMSVDKGIWFSNQKEVEQKIQNLDSDGNLTGDVTGNLTGVVYGSVQTFTETGTATNLDVAGIGITGAAGAVAVTLPVSGNAGQIISVYCTNADNAVTVSTNVNGGAATLTFDAGDGIILIAVGSTYYVVGNNGVVIS